MFGNPFTSAVARGGCRGILLRPVPENVVLYWITITNVHPRAASAKLVLAFFPLCVRIVRLRYQVFIFELAFFSREEAEEAVNYYENNITMFQQTWTFQHGQHTRSMEQARPEAPEEPEASRICFQ